MAAINGQFDLAMELVKRGANVKLASTAGLTPLYAVINTYWAPRSRYPQPQAVQTQKRHAPRAHAGAHPKAGADVNVRLKKNLWFFGYNNCGNANCGLEHARWHDAVLACDVRGGPRSDEDAQGGRRG